MNELGSPESHVAQQSRRDKLRIQQGLSFGPSPAFPDVLHVRDVCGPGMFSSPAAVLDFSVAHSAAPGGSQTPSCTVAIPSAGGILNEAVAAGGLARSGHVQLQANCEWAAAGPSLNPIHQFYHLQLRGYHDGSEDLHFAPTQFGYEGQELASVVGQQHGGRISARPWDVDGAGNELPFLPSYNAAEYLPSTSFMNRQSPQWNVGRTTATDKSETAGDAADIGRGVHGVPTQGLSLSLSSNPVPELSVSQLEDRFVHGDAGPSCSYPKLSYGDRSGNGLLQGAVSAPGDARRGAGPLGPFTGYATILKNSKFLKPAQLLLDEFCSAVTGSRLGKQQCDIDEGCCGASVSVSKTVVGFEKEVENRMRDGNSGGASSSSLYSSSEACGNGMSEGAAKVCRPEFQQKKAKLLYMQEEVCRRYKQYHQQMQMVVSSFESVAGLSSATPYASLGLKTVSKHFRSLKNAISDQLRHVSKILGEELMPSPSSSRGETMTTTRLKSLDQSFRKQKSGESSQSFMDHNQPVWRPQRGLPERAVSVLRAWLFEHFLHPYPTDTDKHMLATQTGLSRNQVSNWFINARVRLWKPMVEEIHMLETKGTNEMDLNSANRKETIPAMEDHDHPSGEHQMLESQRTLPLDCTPMEHVFNDEGSQNPDSWHCDKRSRMDECSGILTSTDGGLMSFTSYQHAMDIGGLGAVSLTLGLRHEGGQQHSRQMRHFENQMFHDFVG